MHCNTLLWNTLQYTEQCLEAVWMFAASPALLMDTFKRSVNSHCGSSPSSSPCAWFLLNTHLNETIPQAGSFFFFCVERQKDAKDKAKRPKWPPTRSRAPRRQVHLLLRIIVVSRDQKCRKWFMETLSNFKIHTGYKIHTGGVPMCES